MIKLKVAFIFLWLFTLTGICNGQNTPRVTKTSIDGLQLGVVTPYLSLVDIPAGCTSSVVNSCTPLLYKLKLKIRAHIHSVSPAGHDVYNYGNNPLSATFKVTPRIINCNNTFNSNFDINPYNANNLNDYDIYFTLSEQNPEATYELEIDNAYYNIISKLQANCKMEFVAQVISPFSGFNTQDLSVDFTFEEIESRHDVGNYGNTLNLNPVVASNPVEFSWNACGYPLYELQILRLYNVNLNKNTPQDIDINKVDLNWDNAFKIYVLGSETKGTTFNTTIVKKLTLAEGSGYYTWRVRPIDMVAANGLANPLNRYTNIGWKGSSTIQNAVSNSITINTSVPPVDNGIFYYSQFDEDKNWIYTRSFIEGSELHENSNLKEDIVSEGMLYANGLGMIRQSQAISNSTNEVIASNSFQDYIGRTALVTLAAATGQPHLGFIDNLGGTFGPQDFDEDYNYKQSPAMGGLISDYYSNNNPDPDVPDAEGFPYSRTLFRNNPLNLVTESSMAGMTHRIQSNVPLENIHTSRNFLVGVADNELVRIFGDEAPPTTSVMKSINIDANNEVSVSYITTDGKTIATCLSKPKSVLLEELSSAANAGFQVVIGVNNNSNTVPGYERIVASNTFPITEPTANVQISYDLKDEAYHDLCASICKECDYDISFSITNDDDNAVVWSHTESFHPGQSFTNPCVNPSTNMVNVFQTNVGLSGPASYTFNKSIKLYNVNTISGITYLDEAINQAKQFYEQEYWQTNSLAPNWQVVDYYNNNAPLYDASNQLLFVNLSTLRQKLIDKQMEGPGGVYELLSIDPTANTVFGRKLIYTGPNAACNEEIILELQACGQPNCSNMNAFTNDLVTFFNTQLQSSTIPSINSTNALNHTSIYNSLFYNVYNQGFYNLNANELEQILTNMNTDPDMPYSCLKIKESWENAVGAYIYSLEAIANAPANSVLANSKVNFMQLFLSNAGLHLTCGTDYDVTGGGGVYGYLSHPYRCFYYPDPNTFSPALFASWPLPQTFNAQNIIQSFNSNYTPPINCLPPSVTYFTANYNLFNYPVNNCDFDETLLAAFCNAIQYETTPSTANINAPMTLGPITFGEANFITSNFEESCKEVCDAKRTLFRELVSDQILINPTYAWTSVEGYNATPLVSTGNYSSSVAALNWVGVITEQIVENCKSKCKLTVQTDINGNVVSSGTADEFNEILKVLNFDPIVKSTNPGQPNTYFDATANNGSSVCDNCLDENGNAISIGCNVLQQLAYNQTVLHTGANYPLPNIQAQEFCGCCPPPDPNYPQYPMEHTDPKRQIDWARKLMLESDRYNSSVYLMIPWLQKKVAEDASLNLGGSASSYYMNIYDLVYNYQNPVMFNGNADFSTYPPDLNTNVNKQLRSDNVPGGKTKNIIVNHDDYSFSVGENLNFTNLHTLNGVVYEYTKKYKSVLAMHGTMKVEVSITPLSIPPAGTVVKFVDQLQDYTGTSSSPQYSPIFKFITDRKSLQAEKTYNGLNSDPIQFSYYVKINDAVEDNAWNISNQTILDAFLANPTNGNLIFTVAQAAAAGINELNIAFSKSNLSSTYNSNLDAASALFRVKVPLLRVYDPTLYPLSQQIAGAYDPDISILSEYILSGGLSANPISNIAANRFVQVIPFFHYHSPIVVDAPDHTKLWDMNNLKDFWQSIMCLQYVPKAPFDNGLLNIPQPASCTDLVANQALGSLETAVEQIEQKHTDLLKDDYFDKCVFADNLKDNTSLTFELGYHHYTLYYYDRAGNLVKTVPPNGVKTIYTNRSTPTDHKYVSYYDYNSLGNVTKQRSPDAGVSNFKYDSKGRIRFSQSAEQAYANPKRASYIKYDYLGRVYESGEIKNCNFANLNPNDVNYPDNTVIRGDVIYTYFTQPWAPAGAVSYCNLGTRQKNLLNKVSYSISDEDADLLTIDDQVTSAYSYDQHGNVEWLAQRVADMPIAFMRYEYDVISNAVTKVIYNEWNSDALFHKYAFDANKKLERVYTSKDGVQWNQEALYQYFKHGPLKTTIVGQDYVQRLDYAYTINGWLKGMNHVSLENNIDNGNVYENFDCNDLFAIKLHYFDNDFKRNDINTSQASAFNDDDGYGYKLTSAPAGNDFNLYNGNIAGIYNAMFNPNNGSRYLYANTYKYDELNRLIDVKYHEPSTLGLREIEPSPYYAEHFEYDANGNIIKASRNEKGNLFDDLKYNYMGNSDPNDPYSNMLEYVEDINSSLPADYDIKPQGAGNYSYDKNGNMTRDLAEGLTIRWNNWGKVKSIYKAGTTTGIRYLYDAMGNRVWKASTVGTSQQPQNIEVYVRDASGNTMANYSRTQSYNGTNWLVNVNVTEQPIYGSNRLGVYVQNQNLYKNIVLTSFPSLFNVAQPQNNMKDKRNISYRLMNRRRYELSDHLGNVRSICGDYRLSSLSGNSPNITLSDFHAEAKAMYNMYAFGMPKYGNDQYYTAPDNINGTNFNYRFGFNGQEKDNEIKGIGNSLDFGARIYDSRLGRFLSIDRFATIFPYLSSYQFASNTPISAIDKNGDVTFVVTTVYIKNHKINVKQETYEVVTAEDIKGVIRSPINILVHRDYDRANFVTKKVFGGETTGEIMKREEPVEYYVSKCMINNPLGTGHIAMALQDRDPFTGEYMTNGMKLTELSEGLLNMFTLGRAGATGKLGSLMGGWLVDFMFEEGVESAFQFMQDRYGINWSQETIFAYHLAKLVRDGKKGEISNLKDGLLKAAEMGIKGKKFVELMKNKYSIDLNMPKDASEATDKEVQKLSNQ